jgi:hypothetical protein
MAEMWTRWARSASAALGTALALAGCGSDSPPERQRTDILLAGYDTTCTVASDCTAIATGQFCPCAPCANAAINVDDLARYQAAVKAIHCQYTDKCGACPSAPAVDCVDGGCALK